MTAFVTSIVRLCILVSVFVHAWQPLGRFPLKNIKKAEEGRQRWSQKPLYLKRPSKNPAEDEQQDFEIEFSREVENKLRQRFPDSPPSKRRKNKSSDSNEDDYVYDDESNDGILDTNILRGLSKWEGLNRALVAGFFVAGIGTGISIDSAINTNPKDLASRDAIDRNAPNPKLCATYGSAAMVLDQRVFVTFNPFSIFVTQADTKPGCVLRPANVVPLLQQERKLLTDADVESCKNGFNTWAFIGDINNKPQLNCVFQSDDAQNEFLSNPKVGLGEDVYDNTNRGSGPLASLLPQGLLPKLPTDNTSPPVDEDASK